MTSPASVSAATIGISRVRSVAAAAAVVAFVIVVALGALNAARRIGENSDRREEALASRSDPIDVVGDVSGSFRRFRSALRPGDRFLLAFSDDVGRDQVGFYRLVALSTLYPAVAVSRLAEADAVMVFGDPGTEIRGEFEELGAEGGVWLGRRRR